MSGLIIFILSKSPLFSSVTNIFERPAGSAGSSSKSMGCNIHAGKFPGYYLDSRRRVEKSNFLFHEEVSLNSRDWHVFRRVQLKVRICLHWSTLSSGRIRWGLEQLEVQSGWMSRLWHCRLWQPPVLPQTGRIYGNGSQVLRRMGDDHCLSHAAIRWNPAGLNLKQMCPINLQVSLGRLMKTNRQAVKGAIHPASFPAQ